jgi:hypothetical protein
VRNEKTCIKEKRKLLDIGDDLIARCNIVAQRNVGGQDEMILAIEIHFNSLDQGFGAAQANF